MDMTWFEQAHAPDVAEARAVADELRENLDSDLVRGALGAIAPVGGTSHQVDEIVHPHAERLGFSSQRITLFEEYPIALRPDWYRPMADSGILLEIERGKTVTNN